MLKLTGYGIVKLSRDVGSDRFHRLLLSLCSHGRVLTFAQIGANDGVRFDGLYEFVTTHNCRGIVVEPLGIYYQKLKENYAVYPDIHSIKIAVHATELQSTMYHVDPEKLGRLPGWSQGIGSLDPNHHKKTDILADCIVTEEVECLHLMELFQIYKISELDLLQIDV